MTHFPVQRRLARRARIFFAFVAWLLAVRTPLSAADYFTVSWEVDDGLPHNAVYRIEQTGDGYLWLATLSGLSRFDGVEFRQFHSPLLGDERVGVVRELGSDARGNLLVARTGGGVATVVSNQVVSHRLDPKVESQRIASFYRARDGAIWFSQFGGVVCRWKDGEYLKVGKFHRAGSGRVTLGEDVQGTLWLAVGDFFGRWNGKSFDRLDLPIKQSYHVAAGKLGVWVAGEDGLVLVADGWVAKRIPWSPEMSPVYTMLEQANGVLWLGTTDNGLFRLQEGKFVRGPRTHPDIACLLEDREHNLWIGTRGGGIYRARERYAQLLDSAAGMPQDVSFSVCQTEDGTVWIANRTGGLVKWKDGVFQPAAADFTSIAMAATVVSPDQIGGLYVGNEQGLFYLPKPHAAEIQEVTALRARPARALYRAGNGEVWVAARSRSFGRVCGTKYEPVTIAKDKGLSVSIITEDGQGNIVVGAIEGEVWRQEGDTFKPIDLGRPLTAINSIVTDDHGGLWIGTAGDGLLYWRAGKVKTIGRAEGLRDVGISQLIWQDRTHLWLGSRSGIYRVSAEELEGVVAGTRARVYPLKLGRDAGVNSGSGIAAPVPSCWRTRDGQLWFATRKGLVRIDPKFISEKVPDIAVHLEEVQADGLSLGSGGEVHSPARPRKVDFRYTGLLFAAPEQVQFRHRLEGYDAGWVDADERREAAYSQLPPGKYRFVVQARAGDREWSASSAALALVVPPAWWQRWSVQAALALFVLAALALAVRAVLERRFQQQLAVIRQKQAIEAERARIARDLHDELGAGLTQLGHAGHFGSAARSPEELRRTIEEVSEQARTLAGQMDAIVWTVNPKNDSLPQMAGYLTQVGQEFFRSLPIRLRVDRPEQVPDIPVTPEFRHHVLMVVKEAFNNVVKHSGATEVWLRLAVEKDRLRVEIADDGRGLAKPGERGDTGDGLPNMATRARELGGSLEMASAPGKGTVVRLDVPLKSANI